MAAPANAISRAFPGCTLPLEDLIWQTTDCLSSDPRDRVYALLGIAKELQRCPYEILPVLAPDYSIENPLELVPTILDLCGLELRSSLPVVLFKNLGGTRASVECGAWRTLA